MPARLVDLVAERIGNVAVDRLAVGAHDAADELRRAHASLDLEGVNACLNELGDVAIHAHVLQGELVRAFALGIQDLARRLVDQFIRPAAGLQTAAAVAALTEEHARMDALAALGHAHVAVHEVFDFEPRTFLEEAQFRERHLAPDDDARDAVFLEFFNRRLVVRIHHDRGVQRDVDAQFLFQLKHGEVLHEDRVGADLLQVEQIFAQGGKLFLADEVVQCDIELDAVLVRKVDGFFQHLVVEIRIAVVHAHVEVLAAQIDGIRARLDGGDEGVPSAGRCEKLHAITG